MTIIYVQYKLFSGDSYYPEGGYLDYQGSYDTIEEAQAALPEHDDWAHIVMNDKIVLAGCLRPSNGDKVWDYSGSYNPNDWPEQRFVWNE